MTTALVCSEKKGKFDFTCTFQHVQSMTRKWTFYPRINQRHLSTSKCLTKLLILLQENRKLERGWRGKPLWVTHCLKNDMSLMSPIYITRIFYSHPQSKSINTHPPLFHTLLYEQVIQVLAMHRQPPSILHFQCKTGQTQDPKSINCTWCCGLLSDTRRSLPSMAGVTIKCYKNPRKERYNLKKVTVF